jgi:hypothetical protein
MISELCAFLGENVEHSGNKVNNTKSIKNFRNIPFVNLSNLDFVWKFREVSDKFDSGFI